MFDTCEQTREFALIEAIAAALREELSVAIEEQPGFRDHSDAGQVNRAFRVMTRTILLTIVPPGEDQQALLNFVLGRLHGGGSRPACSTPTRSITCSAWSWAAATTGSCT